MKKLLILLVAAAFVWVFAAPASAVDWNFYGSARMATYWTSDDFGDFENDQGSNDDDGLQWEWQNNSRLGARVKGENVSGQVELGVKANGVSDVDVGSRRLWGKWDFGSGYLKVGKDYTPANQFISGQVFAGDLGLLGVGTYYAGRPGAIEVGFGGFRLALIDPQTPDLVTALTGTQTLGDEDVVFPKIEASWGMAMDNFNFNIIGGFQTYSYEDVTPVGGGNTNDVDVTSWVIGVDAGITFGPVYIRGAVSYDENGGNAGWLSPAAFWDGDDDTYDSNFLQVALVAGFKMSDMVTFEVGGGWSDVEYDDVDGTDVSSSPWALYAQAVVALAPGVYVIPEVGYFDFDEIEVDNDNADLGSQFYLGAKWQIDF